MLRCGAGEYAPSSKPNSCEDCPAGKYNGDGGYNLGLQNTCQDCPDDEVSDAGSSTCRKCKKGEFRKENSTPTCLPCPQGQYGNSPGAVDTCTECPGAPLEISRPGSTSEEECFFRFQEYTGGENFCTGVGSSRFKPALARIIDTDGTDCKEYAKKQNERATANKTGASYIFSLASAANLPDCKDAYPVAPGKGCAPEKIDCSTNKDRDICPVACSACGSEDARNAGCVQVLRDAAASQAVYTVYYFEDAFFAITRKKFTKEYTPVCAATFCGGDGTTDSNTALTVRRKNWATKDRWVPQCTVSDEKLNELASEETGKFLVFLAFGFFISAANAGAAYYIVMHVVHTGTKIHEIHKLPRKVHTWVWLGVVFKLADMMSDFGFMFITLGPPGDTSNRFYETYEGNADTFRSVNLFFCIIGALFTFPDVYSGYVKDMLEPDSPITLGRVMVCILLSTVFEDGVQLVLALYYVSVIDFASESTDNQAMTVMSILLAVATIIFRIHTVHAMAKKGVRPVLLDSTATATATAAHDRPATRHTPAGIGRAGRNNAPAQRVASNPIFNSTDVETPSPPLNSSGTCTYHKPCSHATHGRLFCVLHQCNHRDCKNSKGSKEPMCDSCKGDFAGFADDSDDLYGSSSM